MTRPSRWAVRKASSESSPQNLRERAVKLAHNSHMYSSCNPRKLVLEPNEPGVELARNYLLRHPKEQPVYGNTELVRKEVIHVGENSAALPKLTLPIIIRSDESNSNKISATTRSSASAPLTSKFLKDVSPSASTVEGSSLRRL
ncbi:hypothetical protein Pmar_PMAR001997 [Perkinsus marinus ATCC 50983]|uniref:Uncharacterized protein n=1 Tax=Perkinsus marinus (strain ATCC 50983 / TXsc) TaxID=423536 RepID=C5LYE2_PERM5|nr:hypothetical protein Pmar_PMAR001997 [Perkinsus marinus ATCC 50983]EEQ98180.1 hypothetical protein Pmar_PMAR001997 [Perkinsus marinus ATCC 50983]|eukprot:XP_002765463.1 hypothetical protein Pmar_PMAR001997 [Perkinsus marinus ATCC 50983]